jgi:hypothetical protein
VISDSGFWASDFRDVQRTRIATFREVAEKRVLQAFANLHDEAQELEAKEQVRLSAVEEDLVTVAEIAFENSAEWYVTMSRLAQGMTNLLAMALYHLFEQMILEFYAAEFVHSRPIHWDRKLSTVLTQLEVEGIECKSFHSWPKIHELRKVAGAVKHGEGHSAKELRDLRPDLFVRPQERANRIPTPLSLDLQMPAIGQGLYVSEEDLSAYFSAVEQFCEEIAKALDELSLKDPRRQEARQDRPF